MSPLESTKTASTGQCHVRTSVSFGEPNQKSVSQAEVPGQASRHFPQEDWGVRQSADCALGHKCFPGAPSPIVTARGTQARKSLVSRLGHQGHSWGGSHEKLVRA